MKRFRIVLAWLCCALVLALGLPRSGAPCAAGTTASVAAPTDDGTACCGTGQCCCGDGAAMLDCGCDDPDRWPEPRSPAPRQPLLDARAERQPAPQPAVPPTPDKVRPPRAAATTAVVPLPHRTRQEVLSVWRL